MSQRADCSLGPPPASCVDLRLTLTCQVLDFHVVYGCQVLHLVLRLEVDGLPWVEPWNTVLALLVLGAVLTAADDGLLFIAAIRLEREATMVAALCC